MAFTIPEGLHPDLNPLAWLVGTWGGTGYGDYPGIEPFSFEQEITFSHDGRPFLQYSSKTKLIDENNNVIRLSALEVGFWRVKPNNVLEVVIAHNTGLAEGWVGVFQPAKIQLAFDKGYTAPTAKNVDEGARLYGLVDGQLFTSYDMATTGHERQSHTWSSLERQVNI